MTGSWRARHRETEKGAHAGAASDLTQVGDHIAKVLTAAEEAAEQLRAEADLEARQTKEEAAKAAEELKTRAEEEAHSERAAARRILEEAEATSAGLRADADEYVEERRRQADAQAELIVRDAEDRAARIAETAADRHRVVLSNIAASEKRLTELATSMRTVAGMFEEVIAAGPFEGDPAETPLAKTPSVKALEEVSSLEDALRPVAPAGKEAKA